MITERMLNDEKKEKKDELSRLNTKLENMNIDVLQKVEVIRDLNRKLAY